MNGEIKIMENNYFPVYFFLMPTYNYKYHILNKFHSLNLVFLLVGQSIKNE